MTSFRSKVPLQWKRDDSITSIRAFARLFVNQIWFKRSAMIANGILLCLLLARFFSYGRFFPPFSSLVYFFSRFDFYCIIKSWCNWTFLSPGVNDVNRRDILRWILIQGWNRWIRRSQRRWLVSFPFRPDVTKAYSLNACHKFVLRHARLLIVKMSSSSFILPVPRVCRDLMKTKISRWLCPKAKPLKKSAGWLFGVVLSPWV